MRTGLRTARLGTAIFCLTGVLVGIVGAPAWVDAGATTSKSPIVLGLILAEQEATHLLT